MSCFSCEDRSAASSFDDNHAAQKVEANGRPLPALRHDCSFDFSDAHESSAYENYNVVKTPPNPAISTNGDSRRGEDWRAFPERRSRPVSRHGSAECVNCSISVPQRISDRLPPGSPGSTESSVSGTGSPTLRSRLPVRVYDEPGSGSCSGSDDDEDPIIPSYLAPGSFDSNTTSSSFHEHTMTYITNHAPIDPSLYSNLRRAIVRTLSGEQLPRGLAGGPLFFGTAVDGYTIAYTFRLPDKFSRGGHRLYSLVALAGFDTQTAYRAISIIWWHFEILSEWIAEKVNEEIRRVQEAERAVPQIPSPPPTSFLTGWNLGGDPFGRRSGGMGLKGRSLVEMTGDDDLFAKLHIKFVELLQDFGR